MLLPLTGLDERELRAELEGHYGAPAGPLEFVPVGEDGWHYRLGDLWISVRRDLRGHLPEAYQAAEILRRSGLGFVIAPLPGADGRVSRMVSGYPVVVFPHLPVSAVESLDAAGLAAIVDLLARVHQSMVGVSLPVETYDLPFAEDVMWALDIASGRAPDAGPYSRLLHELIRAHRARITELYAEFGELSRKCAASDIPLVLTHGEPGIGNVLKGAAGFLLADWGELMWGPAERDWFHLVRSFGSAPPCRPEFLRFYQIRWYFNEFTEYATRFFRSHAGDADDAMMWNNLLCCLEDARR